ncbi:MAG: CpXC domain-containing protein [Anaerolineae bacterium]
MYTQITCPNCRTPYTAEVYQVIDAERDPELKHRLISGQLNLAICPSCGTGGQIGTALLFHDPVNELFMIHIPQELNLNQVDREQLIGQLVKQVMDDLPPEKRRAYMLQPQMVLSMKSFMEKVLETEGITPEMVERQRKQAELLQTLAQADQDVADHLIRNRQDEMDETFFAMLQSYVDAASQMNDDAQLLPLINLRAKLMVETEAGRRLERQQVAVHALSQDAKKEGGLSPALLLRHVLANQEDDGAVNALLTVAQSALSYEFFSLLTAEIEKRESSGDGAAAKRLTTLRERLLTLYDSMQQQSRQMMKAANQTLQAILDAEDREAVVRQHMPQIDELFMYMLSARIAEADQHGQTAEVQALSQVHELILKQLESQMPPEVALLNKVMQTQSEAEMNSVLEENRHLLTPDFLKMLEAVIGRLNETEQDEIGGRLRELKKRVKQRL